MGRPSERPARRRRALERPLERPLAWTGTASAVAVVQALLLMGLSWRAETPPPNVPETVMAVELIAPSPPAPLPPSPTTAEDTSSPQAASEPAPVETPRAPRPAPTPPVPAAAPRPPLRPPPPDLSVLAVQAIAPGPPDLPLIGGARLAGALAEGGGPGGGTGAGSGQGTGQGSGGGDCDMRARLEAALRGDARIRQATAAVLALRDARGQAVLVWDGDWLQSPGEAGKGLAGVRQAIAVEVGFAPRACRDQAVRGLVAIPLDADPAGPKLALGTVTWRWRDLLNL